MTKPILNIVLFNLQQITRDKVLPQMVDVIQSLSEFGINVGLVSDKNRGETKALLETHHKALFDLFDSIVYSKSHLEINSYTDLIEQIDDEFPLLTNETLVINPTIKEDQEFPLNYVIIGSSDFNSDFATTIQQYVDDTFSFRDKSNIESEEVKVPEIIKGVGEEAGFQVSFEKKKEVITEEAKDESVSV